MSLNNKQRKELSARAGSLRAKVQVGHNGLTEGTLHTIDDVLEADELCKIKFLSNTDLASKEEIASLAESLQAEVVTGIGRVLILYRENKEKTRKRALKERQAQTEQRRNAVHRERDKRGRK